MTVNTKIRCEVCGDLREMDDIATVTRQAHIGEVPVTRNVAHCTDNARCGDQARFDADEFVVRMTKL